MEYTTNYNLKKPGDQDNVLVGDLNENMDKVDTTMKELSDGKANLDPDTGKVPDDELPDDLFLKLIGGIMKGNIDMSAFPVSGLVDPVADDHAARKGYVDAQVATRARIAIVSWIGTGTSGSAHPTTITFPFPPKIIIRLSYSYVSSGALDASTITTSYMTSVWFDGDDNTASYIIKCKKDASGKTFSWYVDHPISPTPAGQLNQAGTTYRMLAIA